MLRPYSAVYTFKFYCKNSYIKKISRNNTTRTTEHITKYIGNCIETEFERTNTAIKNAMKRSSVADILVNSPNCGKKL